MGYLDVDFKFHNVGQGLFYTGRLSYGRAAFNFVYDCGSERNSLVKDAIDRAIYQEFESDKKIDLLIISHLHADHANGIPYLLEQVKDVDTVILPYLSPLERLIVALETPRSAEDEEFYNFLVNPVMFLLDREAKRVILLGGEEANRRENWMPPFERPPDLPPEVEDITIDIDTLPDYEPLILEISRLEPELTEYIKTRRLFVKNHSGALQLRMGKFPLWIFRLFNYKVRSNILSQFENCVREILGSTDSTTIKSAILDKNKRNKLKTCYTKLSKYLKSDFNNTSLIVLHLPAFVPNRIECWAVWGCRPYLCCSPYCRNLEWLYYDEWLYEPPIIDPRQFSQFLTGDISLKFKFNEISHHFGLGDAITHTMATLIPHHGSGNNWNNKLCKKISSSFWVVSAGIRNRYCHPSKQVLNAICSNCHYSRVVWVNETTFFGLMGTFEF